MRYLDDDFLGETETGRMRSTGLNSNTTIEILSLDTITRDELIDRVYELLKSFKDTRSMEFIKMFMGNGMMSATELETLMPVF